MRASSTTPTRWRRGVRVVAVAGLMAALSWLHALAAEPTQPAHATRPAGTASAASAAHPASSAHRDPSNHSRQRPPADEIRRSFDAADLDGDGFISLEEFHKNALAAWNALDRNHDGYLTANELEPLPRALRRSLLGSLRHADADGDLRLSFKEVMEARMADFAATDENHDGRLSLQEVMRFRAPRQASAPTP